MPLSDQILRDELREIVSEANKGKQDASNRVTSVAAILAPVSRRRPVAWPRLPPFEVGLSFLHESSNAFAKIFARGRGRDRLRFVFHLSFRTVVKTLVNEPLRSSVRLRRPGGEFVC